MNDFVFINTFFNIVYQNSSAVLRDLQSSYEYVSALSQWLKNRHIDMPILTSLSEGDISMVTSCKVLSDVNHVLHVNLSKELENISDEYREKTHILYIPGFNQKSISIPFDEYKGISFFTIHQHFSKSDLSFFDPFDAFFCAMKNAESWPGVLIFNEHQYVFVPIHNDEDFQQLLHHIDQNDSLFNVYDEHDKSSYILQLSDLHLGRDKREKGMMRLYDSLNHVVPYLKSIYPIKVLITGDLMESPNRKNMYLANDFMNSLKKKYKADVTFILGNHDVIVHGFNIGGRQKSKVIAYLLGESIKVLEKEKLILIKIDTTSEGNLARGKVGQRQLFEIDEELDAIDHLEDYTLFAMLHHHVYPISKAQFIKTKWHENTFLNRIIETSKVLVDSHLLIDWLKDNNVKYVFHGHKHLPFFRKENQVYYIGAGSATGGLKESRSRYISYNILKFDPIQKEMKTCMILYDDKAKAERQRVEVYLFEEEEE